MQIGSCRSIVTNSHFQLPRCISVHFSEIRIISKQFLQLVDIPGLALSTTALFYDVCFAQNKLLAHNAGTKQNKAINDKNCMRHAAHSNSKPLKR